MASNKPSPADLLHDRLRSEIVNWESFYPFPDPHHGPARLIDAALVATSGKRIRYLSLDIDFVSTPRRLELVLFTANRVVRLTDHLDADARESAIENLSFEIFRRSGLQKLHVQSAATAPTSEDSPRQAFAPLAITASYAFGEVRVPLRHTNHDVEALRSLAAELLIELDG